MFKIVFFFRYVFVAIKRWFIIIFAFLVGLDCFIDKRFDGDSVPTRTEFGRWSTWWRRGEIIRAIQVRRACRRPHQLHRSPLRERQPPRRSGRLVPGPPVSWSFWFSAQQIANHASINYVYKRTMFLIERNEKIDYDTLYYNIVTCALKIWNTTERNNRYAKSFTPHSAYNGGHAQGLRKFLQTLTNAADTSWYSRIDVYWKR